MADPKFANLPGIAYDQPDIYETADVVDQETSDYYDEEPENESIERLHISTKDSFNKFKGKYLTGHVDFSDSLSKRLRTGYDARSGEWELAGEGEKESPIQKCRRLQCEMDELMQEIVALQTDQTISKEEKESYEAVGTVVTSAKKVLDSLRLEQVLGKEAVASAADSEIKKLVSQVEEYKKSGGMAAIQLPAQGNELAQSTRIAQLEHSLHQLESAVGARPEKLSRLASSLGTNTLLDAVQQLATKAALLQPTQLDLIEARLNNLATKMDAIAEKSTATNQDSTRDQKTMELYEIAKRTEPITQILPDMLNRMKALESLHNYATNFSKIIAELEATQQTLTLSIGNNKALLQGVQEAFAVNLENVNKEVTKLEERMKKVVDKK
ncbi:dynactin subunit 2 [Bradysia coprophila]|uniref:dynactin subunit 2 n=1 Tax=Bradysia coprophila TaxID=38358 RepID=UPI00187D9A6C|nr:dynactin subunit 2 [Bradysia coprophila]